MAHEMLSQLIFYSTLGTTLGTTLAASCSLARLASLAELRLRNNRSVCHNFCELSNFIKIWIQF